MQPYSLKSIGNGARALLLTSALLSLPLAERNAGAQPAQAPDRCHIRETAGSREPKLVYLTSGAESRVTYWTLGSDARQGESKPAVECAGPVKVSIEVYPIINLKKHRDGDKVVLSYSLDGRTYTREEAVTASGFGAGSELPAGFGIAQPIKLDIAMERGEHEFLLLQPVGFIRMASVEEMRPPEVQPPAAGTGRKAPQTEVQQPKQRSGGWLKLLGPGSAGAEFLQLGSLANGNSGMIAEAGVSQQLRLGNRVSLVLSPRFHTHSLDAEIRGARNSFDAYAAALGFGASLELGGHTLSGMVLPSWEWALPEVGGERANTHSGPGVGGEVFYSYRDYVSVLARAGTDPVNPARLKLHVGIPYSWVKGRQISIEVDTRLLHLLRENPAAGISSSLDKTAFLTRLSAEVPAVRAWRSIVLSVLGGVELEDFSYNGAFVGASYRMEFGRFSVGVACTVTPDSSHRLMMLGDVSMPLGKPPAAVPSSK